MKITDNELENLMSQTNIEPSAQWQTMALENIKKSVTKNKIEGINNSNLNFISDFMNKRKFLVMGLVMFALLAVVGATGLTILNLSTTQTRLADNEILNKIALNNPGFSQIASSYSSSAGATALTKDSYLGNSKLVAPMFPITQDFKYYHTKSTTVRGDAFNKCNYGVDQSQIVFVPVYESFNYSDGTNYHSKYVGYNTDNSINTLSISKSESNANSYKSEDITYFGGSYAVKTTNESSFDSTLIRPMEAPTSVEAPEVTNDSSAVTTPPSDVATVTSDDASAYFGENASVLRTETIDGKDYYVVQTYYVVNCAGYINLNRWESNTVADNRTMYTLTYASTDSYQILKTETYLDSVNSSNLIESTQTIADNSNVDFESVASNFEFGINVPIKEIDISKFSNAVTTYDPDAEIQKAIEFAKSEDITVVKPAVTATNEYVYVHYTAKDLPVNDSSSYYADRNFYAAGDIGEKMYNSYNGIGNLYSTNSTPVALGSVSYSNGDSSYSLNIYSKSEDEKKILNGLLWSDLRNKSEVDTTVTINGTSVAAKLYSFEINQPDVSILPYTDMLRTNEFPTEGCTTDCYKKQYVLIFSYNNSKYSLQEYNYTAGVADITYSESEEGSFSALSANNASELPALETLLTNSIKGTYVDGSSGSGIVPPVEPLKY